MFPVSPIFLKRSVVFPIPIVVLYFFALITEEGFLISPCSSLELYIQMGISFLFSLRLASLLFSAIWKASSDNILPFAFHFLRDGLAQCLLYYCLLITAFSTMHSCHFLVIDTEKAVAPHSSTLAWKIPWTEEPGRLQSMGSLRVGHHWATSLSLFTFMHWRRKCQHTPVFLPGESQGRGSLVGCCLWGRTESDTTEAT